MQRADSDANDGIVCVGDTDTGVCVGIYGSNSGLTCDVFGWLLGLCDGRHVPLSDPH